MTHTTIISTPTETQKCATYRELDTAFHTTKDSPLHHDNRCKKCLPQTKKE